jgi:hypothetical protein
MPFFAVGCFPRTEINTDRAETRRTGLLWRAAKHIRPPSDLETDKSCCYDRGL